MNVQHAKRPLSLRVVLDDEERRNLVLVEQGQRVINQRIGGDRLRIARHEFRGVMSQTALDVPAQVAIRNHPDEVTTLVDHAHQAEPLRRHFDNGVAD